jgi:hypothetical protein
MRDIYISYKWTRDCDRWKWLCNGPNMPARLPAIAQSILIVYSSFGLRVYRELLTCLKCSSFSSATIEAVCEREGELNKHLQPRREVNREWRSSFLTSRRTGAR